MPDPLLIPEKFHDIVGVARLTDKVKQIEVLKEIYISLPEPNRSNAQYPALDIDITDNFLKISICLPKQSFLFWISE
jgi:hypothetical protein